MPVYYNENDPKAAAWLRELIKHSLIALGEVDERSIEHVNGNDLRAFEQCHFFAGIGGWSYALRLAGWPNDQPVWTGSCPCQPFSVAGKQLGTADKRHLWPEFHRLIAECLPPIIFGEQVAGKAGREWLSGVRADLETLAYAVGAADLCAASVSAPHIRQRLYWMANAESGRLAINGSVPRRTGHADERGKISGMGDTENNGCERQQTPADEKGRNGAAYASFWSDFDICHFTGADAGKVRRIESRTFPVANGVPGRVGLLRGYGNAIVPQVAAEFIQASYEALDEIELSPCWMRLAPLPL